MLWRRCIWMLPVEVLFYGGVDLRSPLCRKRLDELCHRLHAVPIAIVDRLHPRHAASIADEIDGNLSVDQRYREVVADDDGEEDGV